MLARCWLAVMPSLVLSEVHSRFTRSSYPFIAPVVPVAGRDAVLFAWLLKDRIKLKPSPVSENADNASDCSKLFSSESFLFGMEYENMGTLSAVIDCRSVGVGLTMRCR